MHHTSRDPADGPAPSSPLVPEMARPPGDLAALGRGPHTLNRRSVAGRSRALVFARLSVAASVRARYAAWWPRRGYRGATMSGTTVVLATASYDQSIRFWDASSGRCARTLKYTDKVVRIYRGAHGLAPLKAARSAGRVAGAWAPARAIAPRGPHWRGGARQGHRSGKELSPAPCAWYCSDNPSCARQRGRELPHSRVPAPREALSLGLAPASASAPALTLLLPLSPPPSTPRGAAARAPPACLLRGVHDPGRSSSTHAHTHTLDTAARHSK